MPKNDDIIIAVANGWSTYKLSRALWESLSGAGPDKTIPIAVTLDAMVRANMAEKLSHVQMISVEGIDEHEEGHGEGGDFFLAEDIT